MQQKRSEAGLELPEVLYLQLDNVYSNKSKTLMRYCNWLVDTGIFKKVKVCFLLVGHTHENIDQMFSRLSVRLRKSDIFTVRQMMLAARDCFTPEPHVICIHGAFDWDSFFRSTGSCVDIHDLSFNHNFKVMLSICSR